MELPRTCVLTIQGGGAVAIDLVGQLQGLTGSQADGDQGLRPAAIAGASAGAIIATLFWVGYKPDQIRDQIAQLFAAEKIDRFFGRGGAFWPIQFSSFVELSEALAIWPRGWLPWLRHFVVRPCRILTVTYAAFATWRAIAVKRGIFPGDGMVREIDQLLRKSPLLEHRVAHLPVSGHLRFTDVTKLGATDFIPLFLTVTDVRCADLITVSSIDDTFQNLSIAQVVRASSGFPGFFQPVRLSDRWDTCIDGGVISNFPAWVFSADFREHLRRSNNATYYAMAFLPWMHVGLRLPAGAAPDPSGFFGFLRGLAALLTGRGRAHLEDKLAGHAPKRRRVNPQPISGAAAPKGVLDFFALSNPELVTDAFTRGRLNGQQTIETGCFDLPPEDDIKPILRTLVARATYLLGPWLAADTLVRANILLPQGDRGEALVIVYQYNMDGDPDKDLRLESDQGVSWLIYRSHTTIVADIGKRQEPENGHDPYLSKPGAPQIRADRNWMMGIPIIDVSEIWPRRPGERQNPLELGIEGPIFGVLNVDASIEYAQPDAPKPENAATHPAVQSLFDAMESASIRCGDLMNKNLMRRESECLMRPMAGR